MKPNFRLIKNKNTLRRFRLHARRKKPTMILVPVNCPAPLVDARVQMCRAHWGVVLLKPIFRSIFNFLKALNNHYTRACEIDAAIREKRAEYYSKYGLYIRDRF